MSRIPKHQSRGINKNQPFAEIWTPPPLGYYEIRIDAAPSNNIARIGVITRNCNGEIMDYMMDIVHNIGDLEHAELIAAWKGVQLASDIGFFTFELEGDSLTVINKLKNNKEDLSPLGHIYHYVRSLISASLPHGIKFVHRGVL